MPRWQVLRTNHAKHLSRPANHPTTVGILLDDILVIKAFQAPTTRAPGCITLYVSSEFFHDVGTVHNLLCLGLTMEAPLLATSVRTKGPTGRKKRSIYCPGRNAR